MIFLPETLAYASAVMGFGLAVVVLLLRPRTLAQWLFAGGMALLGLEAVFSGWSLAAVLPAEIAHWQRLRLTVAAGVPGTWLLFSLCYARGNYREFLGKWWALVGLVYALALGPAWGFHPGLVLVPQAAQLAKEWRLTLGGPGLWVTLVLLLGAVLVLMNLERTFRAAVGTMRWRIKFLVLGLAVLFGVRIYTSSQVLLYGTFNLALATINASALCIASGLIAFSLARARLATADIYPSQAVLQHSLTGVLTGAYLFIVGVLAKVIRTVGGDDTLPLQAFLVMVALVFLGMLLFSDRLQQHTKRFISRHFQRPLHDYRLVWKGFTERTMSMLEEPSLCRAVARLISDTFSILSVTVWLVDAERERLRFAASTSLSEAQGQHLLSLLPNQKELLQALTRRTEPVDIEDSREAWVATWKQCNPDTFPKGGNRVCLPLVSGGELLGVIMLGDRVNGLPYSVEDFDLFKCIGDQVAASLRNLKLSQRLMQARELEAFQTMSAFFVHDLKNTTSTLSLMLRNMSVHFADPAFREDAVRGLSGSVQHLNDLISRLSLLRQKTEFRKVATDLSDVVGAALTSVAAGPEVNLVQQLRPVPRLPLDGEQMQKVVINLVLNAKDAIGPQGEIRVETGQQDGWAVLSVSDNGCGMSPEFLAQSLFKPFQTTKKKGLGIGMFHSKTIVEAHQGKIEVESEPGKGTTFRVLLPLASKVA